MGNKEDNISKILGKLADNQEITSADPFVNKYLLNSSIDIRKIMNKYGMMYDEWGYRIYTKL